MHPDWNYVKKTTLWHYEDLIKKLNLETAYPAIFRAYNHNMTRAANFARCLFPDKDFAAGEFPANIVRSFERLDGAGIKNWGDLLSKIASQDDCLEFVITHRL